MYILVDYVRTLSKILESLDPGCDGKLLMSKLTRDEIPRENYYKLKEFIDTLDPSNEDGDAIEIPEEPEEWYDGSMEEWPEGDVDEEFHWSNNKQKLSSDHHASNSEDDDIQVLRVDA